MSVAGDLGTSQSFENQALSRREEESSSWPGKADLRILQSPLCSGLSPQLLEKWILSEKEWEREKAVNLHLHLMQIYVQSVGVCVSPGDPPPTTCPADTHREMPVSIPGEETPLKSSSVPGETLGKRLPHWGKSKESQGGAGPGPPGW